MQGAQSAGTEPTIILTARAAEEIMSIMKEQDFEPSSTYLRVGIRGGGCQGFNYTLDLQEVKKDSDEAFVHHGVTVICDPKSLLYLNGTEIDFKDELMMRGFVFKNPNATSTCGCGSSFSA